MSRKSIKNEKGMITVEAVLALVPFILIILGIISFINVFMIHNKIQYAMFQAGSELAAYTYFYEALGIRDSDLEVKEDIDKETTEIDKTIEDTTAFLDQLGTLQDSTAAVGQNGWQNLEGDINTVLGEGEKTVESLEQAIESGKILISDGDDLMRNLVYFGIEKAEAKVKSLLLGLALSFMVPEYLESDLPTFKDITADEYLKSAGVVDGVKGLEFKESQLFSDEEYRMIDMVVEYDLEVYFFKLFMKDPTIHVVQRCAIPAWLDGDKKYSGTVK